MTEKHIFADVSLPYHVWIKEGHRWVLRDAALRVEADASARVAPTISERRPTEPRPAPR